MAEDLDDGEFWLPSHFLTDDDIVMDFGFSAATTTHGGSSSSFSDSAFTESDDDDILNLNHQDSSSYCPVHSKVGEGEVLSSSPQSTLCGCVCNHQSSSRESASPSAQAQGEATFDLLNKAAGEVARLKMRIENNKKVVGTGFFDCSQKRTSYPPPPLNNNPPLFFQPQFHHFPPFPPVVWAPSQKNRGIKNENNNSNRPLGLPPSAWPPLQAQKSVQAQAKAKSQPMPSLFVGPPKGTGVFLPRCVATSTNPANQPRKKDANTTINKSKTGKGSESQSNQRRNSSKTSTTTTTMTNHNDIQLPQEWTY